MPEREPLQRPIDPQTPLHQLREQRHEAGRDLKVIITARNSTTGTGKTTLACWLALSWDDDWTAEERATIHVNEFLDRYTEVPQNSVLLMDEAEQLDARRSMSNDNVNFAEKWMMMRVRQVDSILTLPTSSALDKRLKELADIRINVTSRGTARVYRIVIDDHDTSNVREHFMHKLEWPDISDRQEMQTLDELKEEKIEGAVYEGDANSQEAVADGGSDFRDKFIRRAWKTDGEGKTQSEFTDWLEENEDIQLSQSQLSRILNAG